MRKDICHREQIVAYVDGELDDSAATLFEAHIHECEACRYELRAHRLFLCELDAAMANDRSISTPGNFARIVATHAETDMRGVRTRAEHKRALRFIVILGLAAFALLGASAGELVGGSVRVIAKDIFGLASFIWTAVYNTGASTLVIFRVLSRKVFIETGSMGWLAVFLALAVLLLSRLIASYHRARAIE